MKISVIIPAYNEEARIGRTIVSAQSYFARENYDYEIVVVNDGSSDRTSEVVQDFIAKNDRIILIDNKINQGKGGVVKEGMLKSSGDVRVFMDADGSTDISSFPFLFKEITNGNNIVIGSRRVRGAQIIKDQPIYRIFLGWLFRKFVQIWTKVDVVDSQNGFKMFDANAAQEIFSKTSIYGWAFDVEVLAIGKSLGYKCAEVPIVWTDDKRSKVTLKGMMRMIYDLFLIGLQLRGGVYKDIRDKLEDMAEISTKRILGIDFGSKRVGLALSDENRQFALPHATIPNSPRLLEEIVKMADKNGIKTIVLGESMNYKGEPNAINEGALELKKRLEKEGYSVALEPEFMTSVQAERWQGKNDMLDASAAAIILQSYIDKNK